MASGYKPGKYWGKLVSQRMGESKNGNPQIVLTFDIVGEVDPNDPGGDLMSCPRYQRTVYLYLTEKTVERTADDVLALGFTGKLWSLLDPDVPGYQDLTGREIGLYMDTEEYDGKTRERWSIDRPRSGPNVKPLDDKGRRKLDAMFGKALKEAASQAEVDKANDAAAEAVAESKSSKQKVTAGGGDGDESIPF